MPKVLGNRVRFFPSTLAANANFYFKYSSSGGIKMKILNVLDGCLLHLARARACSRLIPPVGDIFGGVSMVTLRNRSLPRNGTAVSAHRNLNPPMAAVEKQPKRFFHSVFLGLSEKEGARARWKMIFRKKKVFHSFVFIVFCFY